MILREVFARSESQARALQQQLRALGENPPVTILDEDGTVSAPAIRTSSNLFEGEAAVSRVIAEVAGRRLQRA